jgi:hypothetical protein
LQHFINRVFDFLLKEKASDIVNSLKGLLAAVSGAIVKRPFTEPSIARAVLAVVLLVVQMLVLAIVLCPLVVLYVLGLYLSAGISLWRLIQHDYGNPDGGANNLKPALNVLYSLAVAQGVVYGYRAIYDSAARAGLVEDVAKDYHSLEGETVLVSDYLRKLWQDVRRIRRLREEGTSSHLENTDTSVYCRIAYRTRFGHGYVSDTQWIRIGGVSDFY